MAEVIPFRGIFYDKNLVRAGDVVAPPYDIITPEMREALYARSPYNVVRIDFGKEIEGDDEKKNKYTRAADALNKWLKDGVLTRSPGPCFYAYGMDYSVGGLKGGQRKRLLGFFGLVRLEEFGRGIYPHEATHSKPKLDRLTLLKVCAANTSPIFSLYDSEGGEASGHIERIAREEPYMRAEDSDGAVHSLWAIDDSASIEAIKAELSDKAIFIADGHHRYETALEYQRIMRAEKGQKRRKGAKGDEPYDYVLMFLANISDGGLTILPAHRLIGEKVEDMLGKISEEFSVKEVPPGTDVISAIAGRAHTFGLSTKEGLYLLEFKGGNYRDINPALRALDVVVLDEMLIKRLLGVSRISYEMDPKKAESEVKAGGAEAAFFLNPTGINEVKEVASASLRMPPKSTYFYPKLLTGFVINSLKNSI